ncbi:helix-turn-helix transcriptional regulator [Candidatus Merdisoma sp. JLR.KK011]|jgi:Predicted transcriptional regulators|uniref:helix-turn-helix domain-containing protein n=1 Tax=Candidatus Merdisoma sp. JLR.KK011 TaxID=3114299 RepID=UPI002FF0E086
MKSFNTEKFCQDLIVLRGNETQVKFSEKLGINRSTLSLLETGKQMPTLEILDKMCGVFGRNPGEYFVESDSDGLIYLMGSLEENDKEKIAVMMDRIKVREKYEALARRCADGICR